MLVGYVSDERYVAVADALLEFGAGRPERLCGALVPAGGRPCRRRAGGVPRDAGEGRLRVEERYGLRQPGASRTTSACCPTACSATPGRSGCRAGEQAEFRVHSVEPYKLELWRYGWEKEFVRGPRLARRARPARHDADHARRRLHAHRRRVEQGRLRQPHAQAVRRPPPSAAASTTSTPRRRRAGASPSRGSCAPAKPDGADRRARLEHHLERLQQLRRPQQLHQRRPAAAQRRPSTRARS